MSRFSLKCIDESINNVNVTGTLTLNQIQVLVGAAKHQGHSISELAHTLDMDFTYVTSVINRLGSEPYTSYNYKTKKPIRVVGLKLVQRVTSIDDRRIRCVYLTQRGLNLINNLLGR